MKPSRVYMPAECGGVTTPPLLSIALRLSSEGGRDDDQVGTSRKCRALKRRERSGAPPVCSRRYNAQGARRACEDRGISGGLAGLAQRSRRGSPSDGHCTRLHTPPAWPDSVTAPPWRPVEGERWGNLGERIPKPSLGLRDTHGTAHISSTLARQWCWHVASWGVRIWASAAMRRRRCRS